MYFLALSLLIIDLVGYVGDGGDDVHAELTIQSLLDNLHMEQSQEATAETEA